MRNRRAGTIFDDVTLKSGSRIENMKADVHAEPLNEGDKLVPRVEGVPLSRLVAYFLRLGTVGFGGPIALVGDMQRDLVEDRHWVSTEDYLQGLAFSQLSPGPLAAQLASYLEWVHSGTLGATLAGIAFVCLLF
jgi:chromate transporter